MFGFLHVYKRLTRVCLSDILDSRLYRLAHKLDRLNFMTDNFTNQSQNSPQPSDEKHHVEIEKLKQHQKATQIFQDKLKALNHISIELDRLSSFDEFCRRVIEIGRSHLGFDRLGLWFLDTSQQYMVGTYGVDEEGNIRDERNQQWTIAGRAVQQFMSGKRDAIVRDDIRLLDDSSTVVGHGWNITVPLLNGDEVVGILTADNLLQQEVLQIYQPELLQIYGATVGYIARSKQERAQMEEQRIKLQMERERIRLLETFIENVAHEFKTPLSIINTKIFLLQHKLKEERYQSDLQTISDQSDFINTMLDQMLLMVRLHSDVEFSTQSVQINELLKSCVQLYQADSAGKLRRWQLKLQEGLPPYQLKFDWFEQAIIELLDNAVNFSDENDGITIETITEDDEIIIRVIDTGIGMLPDAMPFVFDSLYRVDQARTHRGTGLGLTIVKKVVELHSGVIEVDSELGVGSVFTIRLLLT